MRQQGARNHDSQVFVCWTFFQVSLNSTQQTKLPEKPLKTWALLHLAKNGWLLQNSELLETPSATTSLLEFELDFFLSSSIEMFA